MQDNLDLITAYQRRTEEMLSRRPVCKSCGNPIQEPTAYRIGNYLWCEDCIKDAREDIDEY